MPKFISKQKIVEANQYNGPSEIDVSTGATPPSNAPIGVEFRYLTNMHFLLPCVKTIHKQYVALSTGDWVVKEPIGDGYYPIKDEVMKISYEQL